MDEGEKYILKVLMTKYFMKLTYPGLFGPGGPKELIGNEQTFILSILRLQSEQLTWRAVLCKLNVNQGRYWNYLNGLLSNN